LLNQAIPGFPRRQVQIPPHAQAIPLESRHRKLGPIAILMGITDEDIGPGGACQCSRFNCPGLKYANSLPDHDRQAHKEAGPESSQRELDQTQRPLGPNLVRIVLALLQEILIMAGAITLSIDGSALATRRASEVKPQPSATRSLVVGNSKVNRSKRNSIRPASRPRKESGGRLSVHPWVAREPRTGTGRRIEDRSKGFLQ
jgi:hypothetical protein